METTIWTNYNRKFNKFKPISGNKQQLQNKCFGHESNPKSHVFGSTTIEKLDGVEDYKESTQEVIEYNRRAYKYGSYIKCTISHEKIAAFLKAKSTSINKGDIDMMGILKKKIATFMYQEQYLE